MADFFSPTVIQPAIAIADITPLERLLLSHVFNAECEDERLYFYADEGPADRIWLNRARLEAALAQSRIDSTAATVVIEHLARIPADNVEIELDFSDRCWESIFQDIVRPLALLALRHRHLGLHLLENATRRLWRHGGPDHRRRSDGQIDRRHHQEFSQRGGARLGGRACPSVSTSRLDQKSRRRDRQGRVKAKPEAG